MKLSCIIIDDEPAARTGLTQDIKDVTEFDIIATASNAFEALEIINNALPALIFLDIEMPGINGLNFLRLIKMKPIVIVTTAYSQYALDGYELGVIDYLLKPISPERLKMACDKAIELFNYRNHKPVSQDTQDHFYARCNGKIEKINFSEILYIEAANNYVIIRTFKKKLITYHTLKGMECQLPKDNFIKVHKSFIVSKMYIKRITKSEILIQETMIPLSKNFKSNFYKNVISKKLLKR